jgi:hypothetical protein
LKTRTKISLEWTNDLTEAISEMAKGRKERRREGRKEAWKEGRREGGCMMIN